MAGMKIVRRLPLAQAALTVLLAGCGGGLYIGIGDDNGFDDPPQVSLVASAESAAIGQPLRLAAAASDDFGVQRVQFFRLERDGSATSLGNDSTDPYEWDTTMPDTGAAEVRFFARAFDTIGQRSDSRSVAVAVRR